VLLRREVPVRVGRGGGSLRLILTGCCSHPLLQQPSLNGRVPVGGIAYPGLSTRKDDDRDVGLDVPMWARPVDESSEHFSRPFRARAERCLARRPPRGSIVLWLLFMGLAATLPLACASKPAVGPRPAAAADRSTCPYRIGDPAKKDALGSHSRRYPCSSCTF
jgi:hypothetical protein